jgi:hypothetical protein
MGAPMGAQKRRRHAPSTKRKPYQEAHHSHSYSQKKKRRNSRLSSPSQTPGEQRRDGFVTCDGRFDFLEALIRQPGESHAARRRRRRRAWLHGAGPPSGDRPRRRGRSAPFYAAAPRHCSGRSSGLLHASSIQSPIQSKSGTLNQPFLPFTGEKAEASRGEPSRGPPRRDPCSGALQFALPLQVRVQAVACPLLFPGHHQEVATDPFGFLLLRQQCPPQFS